MKDGLPQVANLKSNKILWKVPENWETFVHCRMRSILIKDSSVWHYLMFLESEVSKLCSLCLKVVNVRQIKCPLLAIGRSLVSTKCHFLWHVIENMFDIMIKKRHFNFKYDCVILRQEGNLSRFDFIWQAPSNIEQVKKCSLLYWKNCAIGSWFICYLLI